MLYIVATPIGNLKEITYRAIEILSSVDYIACEDTRTSRVLLDNYNIKKPLISYHKFNETKVGESIISDLKNGKNVAIISDAGMPGISDPGNVVINMCQKENLEYTVVSGPSALINAFVLSGYQSPFTFVGFIPDNKSKAKDLISNLSNTKSVLIFYCSPHSLSSDLDLLLQELGDRQVCFVREISKKFEEITYSTLKEGYKSILKGEFVVLINYENKKETIDDIDDKLKILLNLGLSKNDASKVLAKMTGVKKSDIYRNTIHKNN